MEILINQDLKRYIRPLSDAEYEGLESSCINDGIRDPLVIAIIKPEGHKCYSHDESQCNLVVGDGVWDCNTCSHSPEKITKVLADGHNRYDIAKKHGLEFNTVEKYFDSIKEVKAWMLVNQLSKRNLTKEEESYYRGLRYRLEKDTHGGDRKSKPHNGVLIKSKEIGNELGVSKNTIERDGNYSDAIDKIAAIAGEEVKNEILGRSIKTTKKEINRIAKLTDENIKDIFTPIINKETTNLKEAQHKASAKNIKETPELKPSEKKYNVIYADPPWKYGNSMPNYFDEQADHYPLMSLDEICKMPVKDITDQNAVLFLWVTSPILEESFKVVNSWGFKYKSSFIWDKVKHNMGHYNSVRHEILLVCVKGSFQPQKRQLFDSVQSIERSKKHSQKPEFFREIIDTIYPKGNRIELFSRSKIDNWDTYGNQISN